MNRTTTLVRTLYCCMCVYVVVLQAGSGSPTRKSEFGLAISAWTTGRIARPVRRRRQTSPCSQQTTGVIAQDQLGLELLGFPKVADGSTMRPCVHCVPVALPSPIFYLGPGERTPLEVRASWGGTRLNSVRFGQVHTEPRPNLATG